MVNNVAWVKCGIVTFFVLLTCQNFPSTASADGHRALLQLGGDAQGVGNLLDNCSGYSTEQLLNFLAGVISGSTLSPTQLLIDTQPTNNCNVGGGGAAAGRKLKSLSNDRKLLQLNKICNGLQCLEGAIATRFGLLNAITEVTAIVVDFCDNDVDGSGTSTVGDIYATAAELFPGLAALDGVITADLTPLCSAPVGK